MKIELLKAESISVPDIIGMGCDSNIENGHYETVMREGEYAICYLTAGQLVYNGNPVCGGEGFLAYPNMSVEYQVIEEDTALVWVLSEDEGMASVLETFYADPDTLIFQYQYVAVVKTAFDRLVMINNLEIGYFDIYSVFTSIMQAHYYTLRETQPRNSSEIYLQFSLHYIQGGIGGNIRIEELAKKIGISQAYLYHIFKKNLGISPKEYVSRYRMEQARKLLLDSRLSVTEIGKAVGYSDPMAFSRFFTTRQGISPSVFREQHRKWKEEHQTLPRPEEQRAE